MSITKLVFACLTSEYHGKGGGGEVGHSPDGDEKGAEHCFTCRRIARVFSTALLKSPITAQEGARLRIDTDRMG